MLTDEAAREALRTLVAPFKIRVKRRARGMLRHDYLVPGGPYEEQWDWDAFFIGMALAAEIPSEAIFLRNWALNYIENARADGFTPGLVTPDGPDSRLNHMKPFLAQGAYFASRFLGDWDWLSVGGRYDRLRSVALYRENNGFFDASRGLAMWTDSMESGADNNVALLDFPDKSVVAVDINGFLYLEYRAMAALAGRLGKADDAALFRGKADALRDAVQKHLWCAEDGTYYNVDLRDGSFIRVVGYSSVHPFWAGIATQEQADLFFDRYLLNPDEMRSPFGIRTLSKRDARYNNVNMIKPHSNWQGPLWPIATYLYAQSLCAYGRHDAAREIALQMVELMAADIRATGGMHENYDAETGQPLAAPDFVSWNLLLLDALPQIAERRNPFAIAD